MDGAIKERRENLECYDKLLKAKKEAKLKEIKSSNEG